MALSKGLRLLWKQEPGPSALLEARSRQDCLLLEAGTVAALSKCPGPRRAGPGGFPRLACGGGGGVGRCRGGAYAPGAAAVSAGLVWSLRGGTGLRWQWPMPGRFGALPPMACREGERRPGPGRTLTVWKSLTSL